MNTGRNLSKRGGLILLCGLVLIVIFAIHLYNVVEKVDKAIFKAHFEESIKMIDLLCYDIDMYVESDKDWDTYNYADHLSKLVYQVDLIEGTFAALYSPDLKLLSERFALPSEASLEPVAMMALSQFGKEEDSRIWDNLHIPEIPEREQIYVYLKRVPTGSEFDDRLIIAFALRASIVKDNLSYELLGWCNLVLAVAAFAFIIAGLTLAWYSPRQMKKETQKSTNENEKEIES